MATECTTKHRTITDSHNGSNNKQKVNNKTCYYQDKYVNIFKAVLQHLILIDFSLTVKAVTLIFISGRVSGISSAKKGKSGFIYNLVMSL